MKLHPYSVGIDKMLEIVLTQVEGNPPEVYV